MNLEEKTLSKKYLYNGRIINLRTDTALLPNGNHALREVVEHPGGVGVAALTENEELLLVKQFRYPYQQILLEIPAGKRDPGESPLECGRRELKEETGVSAENFFYLGELYPTPGYCDEVIHIFAARDLSFGQSTPDADEFVEYEKVPFKTAVDLVMSGEIKDAKTQLAILKIQLLKQQGVL